MSVRRRRSTATTSLKDRTIFMENSENFQSVRNSWQSRAEAEDTVLIAGDNVDNVKALQQQLKRERGRVAALEALVSMRVPKPVDEDSALEDLRKENVELKQRLEERRPNSVAALKEDEQHAWAQLDAERSAWRAKEGALMGTIASIRADLDASRAEGGNTVALATVLKAAEEKARAQLEATVAEKKDALARMRCDLHSTQRRLSDAMGFVRQAATSKKRALESAAAAKSSKKAAIAQLSVDLRAAQKRCSDAMAFVGDMRRKVARVEADAAVAVAAANAKAVSMRTDMHAAQRRCSDALAHVGELRRLVQAMADRHAAKVATLEAANKSLRTNMHATQRRLSDAMSFCGEQRRAERRIKAERQAIHDAITSLQSDMWAAQRRVGDASSCAAFHKAAAQEAKATAAEARRQLQAVQRQLNTAVFDNKMLARQVERAAPAVTTRARVAAPALTDSEYDVTESSPPSAVQVAPTQAPVADANLSRKLQAAVDDMAALNHKVARLTADNTFLRSEVDAATEAAAVANRKASVATADTAAAVTTRARVAAPALTDSEYGVTESSPPSAVQVAPTQAPVADANLSRKLQAAVDDMAALNHKVARLTADNTFLRSEVDAATEAAAVANRKASVATADTAAAQKEAATATAALVANKAHLERALRQSAALNRQVATLTSDNKALKRVAKEAATSARRPTVRASVPVGPLDGCGDTEYDVAVAAPVATPVATPAAATGAAPGAATAALQSVVNALATDNKALQRQVATLTFDNKCLQEDAARHVAAAAPARQPRVAVPATALDGCRDSEYDVVSTPVRVTTPAVISTPSSTSSSRTARSVQSGRQVSKLKSELELVKRQLSHLRETAIKALPVPEAPPTPPNLKYLNDPAKESQIMVLKTELKRLRGDLRRANNALQAEKTLNTRLVAAQRASRGAQDDASKKRKALPVEVGPETRRHSTVVNLRVETGAEERPKWRSYV